MGINVCSLQVHAHTHKNFVALTCLGGTDVPDASVQLCFFVLTFHFRFILYIP